MSRGKWEWMNGVIMRSSTETSLWAGSIIRYHNRPTARRQTVGEHTWRVMIIYTELYGIPRAEVYHAILYHDVPEIVTGDVPFMAKRYSYNLKKILTKLEEEALGKLQIKLPSLSSTEEYQIKIADLLEMLFFAVEDVQMGCQYSIDIIENILDALGVNYDQKINNYIKDKGIEQAISRICSSRKS